MFHFAHLAIFLIPIAGSSALVLLYAWIARKKRKSHAGTPRRPKLAVVGTDRKRRISRAVAVELADDEFATDEANHKKVA